MPSRLVATQFSPGETTHLRVGAATVPAYRFTVPYQTHFRARSHPRQSCLLQLRRCARVNAPPLRSTAHHEFCPADQGISRLQHHRSCQPENLRCEHIEEACSSTFRQPWYSKPWSYVQKMASEARFDEGCSMAAYLHQSQRRRARRSLCWEGGSAQREGETGP
jgi:hypothetical protein